MRSAAEGHSSVTTCDKAIGMFGLNAFKWLETVAWPWGMRQNQHRGTLRHRKQQKWSKSEKQILDHMLIELL